MIYRHTMTIPASAGRVSSPSPSEPDAAGLSETERKTQAACPRDEDSVDGDCNFDDKLVIDNDEHGHRRADERERTTCSLQRSAERTEDPKSSKKFSNSLHQSPTRKLQRACAHTAKDNVTKISLPATPLWSPVDYLTTSETSDRHGETSSPHGAGSGSNYGDNRRLVEQIQTLTGMQIYNFMHALVG